MPAHPRNWRELLGVAARDFHSDRRHVEIGTYLGHQGGIVGLGHSVVERADVERAGVPDLLLRRQVLDCLRRGELEEAENLLAVMDDVYTVLITIDYPEALTGGLRRASDALRGVLERTRGDVTNALVMARMQEAIEGEAPRRDG